MTSTQNLIFEINHPSRLLRPNNTDALHQAPWTVPEKFIRRGYGVLTMFLSSHQRILQRAGEAIGPFIFMDLFGCWLLFSWTCLPLSTWTCFGVRLYVHGLVWLSVFIYMDLFGFSALFSWTCLVIRLYPHELVWLFTFAYMDLLGCSPLFMLAGLVVYLYLHGLVWLLPTLSELVVRLYRYWLVLL